MKNFLILTLALFVISVSNLQSQNHVEINDIEIINMGDGQMFAHKKDSAKTPLEGRLRLITGKTTEYTETEFKEGFMDGKWEHYENNKLLVSASYKDGYQDGEYIKLSSSGDILLTGSYIRGKKEGTWDEFNYDGDKKNSITYKGDEATQKLEYYVDGSVNWERNYRNGKEHGVKRRFNSDGILQREETYVNGRLVGKQYIYYMTNSSTGNFTQISHYNDRGRKEGEFIESYTNGQIKTKGKYLNNCKDGKWIHGNPDGTIYREQLFKNCKLIEDSMHDKK